MVSVSAIIISLVAPSVTLLFNLLAINIYSDRYPGEPVCKETPRGFIWYLNLIGLSLITLYHSVILFSDTAGIYDCVGIRYEQLFAYHERIQQISFSSLHIPTMLHLLFVLSVITFCTMYPGISIVTTCACMVIASSVSYMYAMLKIYNLGTLMLILSISVNIIMQSVCYIDMPIYHNIIQPCIDVLTCFWMVIFSCALYSVEHADSPGYLRVVAAERYEYATIYCNLAIVCLTINMIFTVIHIEIPLIMQFSLMIYNNKRRIVSLFHYYWVYDNYFTSLSRLPNTVAEPVEPVELVAVETLGDKV